MRLSRRNPQGTGLCGRLDVFRLAHLEQPSCLRQTTLTEATTSHPAKTPSRPSRVIQRFPNPSNASGPGALALLDPDPSFAGDGTLEYAADTVSYAWFHHIEPSGDIMLIGMSSPGSPSNDAGIFQRILADGTPGLAQKFGNQGFGCSAPRFWLTGIRLSTGFYAGGGYRQEGCGGLPRLFDVVMWSPTPPNPRTFFEGYEFFNQLAYILALAEQPDGKIVGAGYSTSNQWNVDSYDMAVARWNADGTKDLNFGTDGEFVFDVNGDWDFVSDMIIDSEGRIVLAGSGLAADSDLDQMVVRLTPTGEFDTSFATDGVFILDHAGFQDGATSIEEVRGGRLVIGGYRGLSEDSFEPLVLGMMPDGQLDSSFGTSGQAVLDFGSSYATVSDIALGAGGLIYVTGAARIGGLEQSDADGVVTVLRSHGVPDPRFNGGVAKTFSFGDDESALPGDFPRHISLSELNDRIVISGHTRGVDTSDNRMGVARFIGLDPLIFSDRYEP